MYNIPMNMFIKVRKTALNPISFKDDNRSPKLKKFEQDIADVKSGKVKNGKPRKSKSRKSN